MGHAFLFCGNGENRKALAVPDYLKQSVRVLHTGLPTGKKSFGFGDFRGERLAILRISILIMGAACCPFKGFERGRPICERNTVSRVLLTYNKMNRPVVDWQRTPKSSCIV